MANPYIKYTDPTPGDFNALDVRDAALSYVGALWGGENCTGLVWAVADAIGASYYETVSGVASASGETEAQVRTVVPDAGDTNFKGYVLPRSEGSYGTGSQKWITNEYKDGDWSSHVKIRDLVRIPKNTVTDLPDGHSFIVVGGDAKNGWEVVDNIGPNGVKGVKPIKKHTYKEGTNSLFPKILAASDVLVSELALPEIETDNLTTDKSTIKTNDTVALGAVIHNYGNVASGAVSTRIYISPTKTFNSATAIPITTFSGVDYISHGPGTGTASDAKKELNASVTFDNTLMKQLSSGQNYLIVIADHDHKFTDLNPENNSYSIPVTVDTTAPTEPQSTLPVAVGGAATISTAFLLSYDDISGPDAVTYRIVQVPTHGTLLIAGVATGTFTQADIDAGRVQYSQNGDAATNDGFTFTVSDAAGNTIGPEPFTIAIMNTTDPVAIGTDFGTVSAGGDLIIWKDALSTVALGNDPAEMVYSIVDAPVDGALIIDNQPVSSFTQADIDDHRLNYIQTGGPADSDSFSFIVTDASGTQTAPQTFQIQIQDGTGHAASAKDPTGNLGTSFADVTTPATNPDVAASGDGAYDRDDVYAAVAARHPAAAVVVPPRANAVPSEAAERAPTQRDWHLRCITERGRLGWQKASGYNRRALVEADISRWKRVIGGGLRFQTDKRRATEVAIAANVLNRMLELGRPEYVRIA